jgi:FtsP/CotA-like multicopper oxidase with cupredoxin domain
MRIAVHFDDYPGKWMFHCHILDHEDDGMMGVLEVR